MWYPHPFFIVRSVGYLLKVSSMFNREINLISNPGASSTPLEIVNITSFLALSRVKFNVLGCWWQMALL